MRYCNCCIVGTGNGDDNPCPTGYYCPEGSALPEACPAGMYGNVIRAESPDDCALCPVDTYNNLVGQVSNDEICLDMIGSVQ